MKIRGCYSYAMPTYEPPLTYRENNIFFKLYHFRNIYVRFLEFQFQMYHWITESSWYIYSSLRNHFVGSWSMRMTIKMFINLESLIHFALIMIVRWPWAIHLFILRLKSNFTPSATLHQSDTIEIRQTRFSDFAWEK